MNIYNGTAHEITFYAFEDTYPVGDGRKLVLKEGAKPIQVVPKGTNLNCVKGNRPAPLIEGCPIPLNGAVQFINADPLPPGYGLYIVSNLYRAAVVELGRDSSRLATVDGSVYADEAAIRPCGCLALAVG